MYTQTSTLGGGGGSPFTANCPTGEYITQWYGTSNKILDSIGAICSDGTNLGYHGGGGGNFWSTSVGGPYINFSGRAGSVVDNFGGHGGGGGSPWNDSCPSGAATGIFGRSGTYTDQLGIKCGVPIRYCINNLEDPMCRGVDANTLNKACSVDFTPTCINRKDELTDTTMNKYCDANPYAAICSCYTDPPEFIPKTISGLSHCWNKKCADYGYIPKNMRQSCPNITICTQDMKTSGNSNVLTNNIIVQNCTSNVGDQSNVGNQSNTSNTMPKPNTVAEPQSSLSSFIAFLIIILVCFKIFILDTPMYYAMRSIIWSN
jgi:hypothetical protein